MQPYDIVSKLWIEQCTAPFLKELVGAKITRFRPIEEAAQEQPSINKADYVVKTRTAGGTSVFLLEFLTRWEADKLIDFARYTLFCKKKFRVPMRPVLVLFLPHSAAQDVYQDECVTFRFQLVKLYEIDAADILARRIPELYPLIPLMKGGVRLAERANRALLESKLARSKKADLLTVLRVFLGLRDKLMAARVRKEQNERMNVMAESPVFQEIVKLGLDQGRAEGRTEGLREAIKLGLEIRFGDAAQKLAPVLAKCSNVQLLEQAAQAVKTVPSLQEFQRRYLRPQT